MNYEMVFQTLFTFFAVTYNGCSIPVLGLAELMKVQDEGFSLETVVVL